MASDKLTINIGANTAGFKKGLKGVEGAVKFTANKLASLAKVASVGFGAVATGAGLAIKEAGKFETITTQFEVLTGSVEQAKKTVKDLQNFAATTPFQFEGIAKASQQLLGFGFGLSFLL